MIEPDFRTMPDPGPELEQRARAPQQPNLPRKRTAAAMAVYRIQLAQWLAWQPITPENELWRHSELGIVDRPVRFDPPATSIECDEVSQ